MNKGYVQVYTGNGKGKTTCMLGLTLRAVGAGKSVYIGQFMKYEEYSEIKTIKQHLPRVTIEQYGAGEGFIQKNNIQNHDITAARAGYQKALAALTSEQYDIVVIDEINVAVYFELLTEDEVLKLIESKPIETELVLTGRYATEAIIEKADLVTEMKEIKHYYSQNVPARVGIEK